MKRNYMKAFLWKIIWALSWMFIGLMIAYNNNIVDPLMMATLSIGSLIFGDMLKIIIKAIAVRTLT